jgi:hypothetical protein
MIAGIVIYAVVSYFKSPSSSSTSIQSTIVDGKKTIKSKQHLPRSFDQKEGIAFSFTCWIKIDDFAYRFGQQKVIFNKGTDDLATMCPALLLDGNTNSLLIKVDTFGGTEIIPISNIPAKKWLHVAIAIDQNSVNVYINGILHTHHSLTQLPRQNNSVVTTGIGGGFDGQISNLEYYSYFMTPENVQSAMSSVPKPDPSDSGPLPPYFDMTWWTGR